MRTKSPAESTEIVERLKKVEQELDAFDAQHNHPAATGGLLQTGTLLI